jgi:hypothetical protein
MECRENAKTKHPFYRAFPACRRDLSARQLYPLDVRQRRGDSGLLSAKNTR